MPIPAPFPGPTPGPSAPAPPTVSRHSPFWLQHRQGWAQNQVTDSHLEALYLMGELSMFVLMWHPADHAAGLVDRCSRCYLGHERVAAAYRQPTEERCPSCFGTSFEGGFRARIIRPAMWTDTTSDTIEHPRGNVVTDTMAIETTHDFSFRHGDYILRASGGRYQGQELTGAWIRTGFDVPDRQKSVAGLIGQARLEAESSVAYLIPPAEAELEQILRVPLTDHYAPAVAAHEIIRGPLVV